LRSLLVALNVVEGKRQNDGELIDEAGLEGRKPVLAQTDERCCDGLMRAALGGEGYP
jgi:hypothetical protein